MFEPLEARLLLSADLGVEVAAAAGAMQADYGAVVEGAFDAQAVNRDDPAYAGGADALLATTRGAGGQPALSASAIAAIESEAIARWEASGLIDVSALDDVRFAVVDLPGRSLGLAVGRTILVDRDAAGHGWFVDPTPADDEEFAAGQVVEVLLAPAGSPAFGRIDLLTALGHELGHMAGQDHDGLAVMRVSLALNERVADFTAEAFAPPEPPPLIKSEHGTVVHYFDYELAALRRAPAPQPNEVALAFYYERATASLVAADETVTTKSAGRKVQIDWHGGLNSAAKSAAFETLQKLKAGPNASIRLR
ncbi:MAG TPA: LEPR-XLL domain-containing protein [Burkholderiales bacterium]|nr:LEPR-XLL domain-containing protein [Burkholderiales bacterium]